MLQPLVDIQCLTPDWSFKLRPAEHNRLLTDLVESVLKSSMSLSSLSMVTNLVLLPPVESVCPSTLCGMKGLSVQRRWGWTRGRLYRTDWTLDGKYQTKSYYKRETDQRTCLPTDVPPVFFCQHVEAPVLSPPAVRSRLLRLRSLWDEIRQRAEEREGKLNDVLDLAGKFWADVAALLSTLRDSQDIVRELEDPGVDPSLIKQQIEAAEVRRS